MRARSAARARPGRDRARRGRGPRRACPLGGDALQSAMTRFDPAPGAKSQGAKSQGAKSQRLVAVTLDEKSIGRSGPDVEHERAVAIYDLLEENLFAPVGDPAGPFAL